MWKLFVKTGLMLIVFATGGFSMAKSVKRDPCADKGISDIKKLLAPGLHREAIFETLRGKDIQFSLEGDDEKALRRRGRAYLDFPAFVEDVVYADVTAVLSADETNRAVSEPIVLLAIAFDAIGRLVEVRCNVSYKAR
jgi:hypothetical protein